MSKEASANLKLRAMEFISKELRAEVRPDQGKLFKECHSKWPQLGREDFDELYLLGIYIIEG